MNLNIPETRQEILSDRLSAGGQIVAADIANEFIEFIKGAELVIHNAPFDVGFLDTAPWRRPQSTENVSDFFLARTLLSR